MKTITGAAARTMGRCATRSGSHFRAQRPHRIRKPIRGGRYTGLFMSHYLAFDFGAESGRALVGTLQGGRLSVEEIHRFPNTPVRVQGRLYWDTLRLWHEI